MTPHCWHLQEVSPLMAQRVDSRPIKGNSVCCWCGQLRLNYLQSTDHGPYMPAEIVDCDGTACPVLRTTEVQP